MPVRLEVRHDARVRRQPLQRDLVLQVLDVRQRRLLDSDLSASADVPCEEDGAACPASDGNDGSPPCKQRET
jgi:hypothetical protein